MRRRREQRSSWSFARAIKAALQGGRCRWAAEEGLAVEYLLAPNLPLICEAWIRMRGCYKDALDRPPPPAKVSLATMISEREELYRNFPSPGETIPVRYLPFSVDAGIPENEDISWAVRKLRLNRLGGPSGIRG